MRHLFPVILAAAGIATASPAAPTDSVRPEARPRNVAIVAAASRAIDEAASRARTDAGPALGTIRAGLGQSLRPRLRPGALVTAGLQKTAPLRIENPAFDRWVAGFKSRARSAGISQATLDAAFAQAHFLPEVIKRDQSQSEFTLSVGAYLSKAASDSRIETGREMLVQHDTALRAIEARYGVDRHIVAAVWGMESNFGANRGRMHLVSSLATLAFEGRRGRFFESQLTAALRILQSGDTTEARMLGSWAGAMGHTQFIPTSYLAYAVDFTGDGRRDIWADDPTDALASTAAYLARFGWVKGQPWGVEVTLPQGFDYAHSSGKRMPSDWARLGVTDMDGGVVPNHGTARLLLPAGADGPAFLVFKNFDVIKRYNNADAYAMGVGHLGDRLAGRGPVRASWPKDERSLLKAEAREMQRLLTANGFSTGGVDGRIGGRTIAAIRAYQRAKGLPQDGYPSVALLKRLRN